MARQPYAPTAPAASKPAAPTASPGGPPEIETGGTFTIDLGAIAANYRLLASKALPAECAAVVKADAYGCGLERVTSTLDRAGCRTFFVAQLAEARRVRARTPDAAIYVLSGYSTDSGPAFAEIGAEPVINSSVELAEWDYYVATTGLNASVALHIDTGMNRLGLSVEEAAAVASRVAAGNHRVSLLMSHLACADNPDHPATDKQIRQFREIRAMFRGIQSSLANSAGIFFDAAAHCDLVRPGIALYGGNPVPSRPNPMHPVVELKVRILQVRHVPKGAMVGYGATWTAPRDSRIAVIAAGYADGIPRAATTTESKPAAPREVVIAGRRCRIVGRISMDLITVDVTDLPSNEVQRGQMATLIGDGLTLDEVATQAGTISYELLTHLGRRLHRKWKE